MTKTMTLAIAVTAMIGTSGCNTVNGAGKDMKSAGTAISDASGESKKK